MSNIWSGLTYPDLVLDQILLDLGPCTWAGPDQIFGTERYCLHNKIWSDKDFGPDQIGFVNGANVFIATV